MHKFTIALFSGLIPVYNGRRYTLMKLLGGITFLLGCEYGDRFYQCRNIQPFDCYVERNRQICCERCEELRQQMQANGKNLSHLHTGKCIRRFGGIYAYCWYFIDRKW